MSWTVERRKQALKRWALMTGWPCIQQRMSRTVRMEKVIGGEQVEVRRAGMWPGYFEARYVDGMRFALRWADGSPVVEWKVGRNGI